MNRISKMWHSLICGCRGEEHSRVWNGWWARWLFPIMTAASVAWFLVRVIPKPIRATYPCQQAAFPLLSAMVVWVLSLKAGFITWLRARRGFCQRGRPALFGMVALVVLGLMAWAAEKSIWPAWPQPMGITYGTPSGDPPNSPIGQAKGIFPGRVTWIRDTNATPWDGTTGYWWQDTNGVNQAVVDRMVSSSLRVLTGTASDAEAWDRIFRFYNTNHSRGNVGYSANETVAIKINLNNNPSGSTGINNFPDASKQTVLALLRQLVNEAGVTQSNIVLYDAVRSFPSWLYDGCHAEFPLAQWVSGDGDRGQANAWVTNNSYYSVWNDCGGRLVIPQCVSQATYLINVPLLKGHDTAGVTLAGKNHYGSIPVRDHSAFLGAWAAKAPLYSMLVDLMGSAQLGSKTILYVNDALFGNVCEQTVNNRTHCAFSNLFNGEWSASIFMSLDPVAIDSVGIDFLYAEFGLRLGRFDDPGAVTAPFCDHYLHEAALADNPPSGTIYQPDGVHLHSLGVHEHWNNPVDKQYSRNLNPTGSGIELVALHQMAPAQVALVSPTNGAVFAPGSSVLLEAAVTNSAYMVFSQVDFLANGMFLGTSTNAPFRLVWTNPPAGTWTLLARGSDPHGFAVDSPTVTVQVLGVSVAITNPAAGASVSEGSDLAIQASARSDFGSIMGLDFYANDLLLGSRTNAPFGLVWSNAPAGNWNLRAVASDASGLSATSAVVSVSVRRDVEVSLVQPSSGAVFEEGTNVELVATATSPLTAIARVDFYDGGTLVGTASAAPYSLVRNNAQPGLWSLTAVATETGGFSATTSVVSVTIKPSQLRIAGALYVDLRATDFLPGCSSWTNHGVLGDFQPSGAPALELNALGTAFPGIRFSGFNTFIGPSTVPDLEGSSDRSVEVWALAVPPLSSFATLVSWGDLYSSFSAGYGTDLSGGAFLQSEFYDPDNTGWVPPLAGVWHHLVYVYDGDAALNIYVDGVLTIARTLPAVLHTATNLPILLADSSGAILYPHGFSGYINSVRVHGGAMTAEDVWLNYLAGPSAWDTGPVGLSAEPADLTVAEGGSGLFSVLPNGNGPFTYQWYGNGVLLAGGTNSTWGLSNVQWSDSGSQFYCVVSRPYYCSLCTTTSRVATLTVQPEAPVFLFYSAMPYKQKFVFIFSTVPGGNYRVDYSESLNPPVWQPFAAPQTASGSSITISDPDKYVNHQQRFYRITRLR